MPKKKPAQLVIIQGGGLIHEVLGRGSADILVVDYDHGGVDPKDLVNCPALDGKGTCDAWVAKLSVRQNAPKVESIFSSFALASRADVQIYCDGAASPNPGAIGSGLAVYRGGALVELWYGLYSAEGTNSVAELNALHRALLMAEDEVASNRSVQVLSDSRYALDAIGVWAEGWQQRGWRKRGGKIKNLEIIQAAHPVYERIKSRVQLNHVAGHVGTEGNEMADRMAALAVKRREPALRRYEGRLNAGEILRTRAA